MKKSAWRGGLREEVRGGGDGVPAPLRAWVNSHYLFTAGAKVQVPNHRKRSRISFARRSLSAKFHEEFSLFEGQ
jgi:hypothetical protein